MYHTPLSTQGSKGEGGSCDDGSQLPPWTSALLASQATPASLESSAVQALLFHLLLWVCGLASIPASPQVTQHSYRGEWKKAGKLICLVHSWAGAHCISHIKSGSVLHMVLTLSETNYVVPARKH